MLSISSCRFDGRDLDRQSRRAIKGGSILWSPGHLLGTDIRHVDPDVRFRLSPQAEVGFSRHNLAPRLGLKVPAGGEQLTNLDFDPSVLAVPSGHRLPPFDHDPINQVAIDPVIGQRKNSSEVIKRGGAILEAMAKDSRSRVSCNGRNGRLALRLS